MDDHTELWPPDVSLPRFALTAAILEVIGSAIVHPLFRSHFTTFTFPSYPLYPSIKRKNKKTKQILLQNTSPNQCKITHRQPSQRSIQPSILNNQRIRFPRSPHPQNTPRNIATIPEHSVNICTFSTPYRTRSGPYKYTQKNALYTKKQTKGLYRGFVFSTLAVFPGIISHVSIYTSCKHQFSKISPENTFLHTSVFPLISGMLAETIAVLCYVPEEVVLQRLQLSPRFFNDNNNKHSPKSRIHARHIIREIYSTGRQKVRQIFFFSFASDIDISTLAKFKKRLSSLPFFAKKTLSYRTL